MEKLYITLYAPSSVQKLIDFLKTVYAVDKAIPVIIRPFGAAAQVGIPEAHRISYKLGKPLIVLPELRDLRNIVNCEVIYYLSEEGDEADIQGILRESQSRRIAIVLNSGEQEPSRKELEEARVIWPSSVPKGISPIALTGILIYELSRL